MPDDGKGRSIGDVASRAWESSARSRPGINSSDLRDPTGITRVNRFAREFARIGSGYRNSPNRNLLRGSARRGLR
jgi:hypothetical protein